MKKTITTMLTVLALSTLTHARVGETVAECNARYGGTDDIGRKVYYKKSGYLLAVEFDTKGRCGEIVYSKPGADLSNSEIRAFIRANGSGWVEKEGTAKLDKWKSADKMAYFYGGILVVRSLVYEAAKDAEAEREKQEKLNAF